MQFKFIPDEKSLLDWGTRLAERCSPPCAIFLYGQLGAGKTTLVRGFLRGLGYADKVKSPSYAVVEPYVFPDKAVFHFDFYRIQDPAELEFIGMEEYWQPSAIFLVEWPEKMENFLPPVDVACYLEIAGYGRKLGVEGRTARGEQLLVGF